MPQKVKGYICTTLTGFVAMVILQSVLLSQYLMAEMEKKSGSYERSEQQESKDDVDFHIKKSTACYRNGDLECAINELEKAKKLRPQDAQIHFMLGNAYYRKKDWDSSVAKYLEAASFRPDHPDTYLNLGFSYYNIEQVSEAVEAWETGVLLSPEDRMARMALAVGLFSMGSLEDAVFHFSQALELRPDSCDQEQLAIDIRWRGDALAHVKDLCELLTSLNN